MSQIPNPFVARSARVRVVLVTLAAALLSFATIALSGCAYMAPAPATAQTSAIEGSTATRLGAIVARHQTSKGATGARLLYRGDAALEARLALIHEAAESLDLQYYHFEPDSTGRLISAALVDAARRGVRVRLLIDDWYTVGSDDLLAGLSATRGIEVKLYNPFSAPFRDVTGRKLSLVGRFSALNARMHNKLFIADGAAAIVGGRNIADAYFERGPGDFFIDLDVLLAGAVVPDLAALFDTYWNSTATWPLAAVIANDPTRKDRTARLMKDLSARDQPRALAADRFGRGSLGTELEAGQLDLNWQGTAVAFADKPLRRSKSDLVLGGSSDEASSIRELVWRRMARSNSEYLIVTPYLVPGELGMTQVARNTGRGVHISILTNSLASTDVPWVHAAYRRYRVPMLAHGVELMEMSASTASEWGTGSQTSQSRATLHAKCVVFDRQSVFFGSLNFDPRSMSTNTEIGILLDNKYLASEVLEVVRSLQTTGSYELTLSDERSVQWRRQSGGPALDVEPEATFTRRFLDSVLSPLLPESML